MSSPRNHSTLYQSITSAWHVRFTPAAIIEIVGKKTESPGSKVRAFFVYGQINEDFTDNAIDCKDFTTYEKPRSRTKPPAMKTLHTFIGEGEPALTS
jgi:hypothetical protein